MAVEVRVPTLGESVTEATVATWFKQPGERVEADEPLCELETDKVTLEVPAPAAGVLGEHVAKEGDTVEVGALLTTIEEGAAARAAPAAKSAAEAAPAQPAPEPAPERATAAPPGDVPASPAAKKLMAEAGIGAAEVEGTGKGGRVMKEDVQRAIARRAEAPARAPQVPPMPEPMPEPVPEPMPARQPAARPTVAAEDAAREKRVRMTRLRQTIARRLKEAQNTAAILTTYNEADMSAVMALRNRYKEEFEKKHGVRLGFMSFFVKACVHALKEIPAVNAEIDGDEIVYKNYYHIGVAVGTPQGLVVPVVRDADRKSFAEIEKEIATLGAKARDGKLSLEEMQGGTFSISNGGIYGSLMSSPILNPPQSGILGMHKIQDRPVAVDGQVVIRPMMYLALSYDHRIVDGREAVTFLVRVKQAIEDPQRLLIDL